VLEFWNSTGRLELAAAQVLSKNRLKVKKRYFISGLLCLFGCTVINIFVGINTSVTDAILQQIVQSGYDHISIDSNDNITDHSLQKSSAKILGLRFLNMPQLTGACLEKLDNAGFLYLKNCPHISEEAILRLPVLKYLYLRLTEHVSDKAVRILREKGVRILDA
jgi:hypothetical protein